MKSGITEEPLNTVAFKTLSFSSYTLLSAFVQLLETYLEVTMHYLLQHLNVLCIPTLTLSAEGGITHTV
jgi:hypothetical protein